MGTRNPNPVSFIIYQLSFIKRHEFIQRISIIQYKSG